MLSVIIITKNESLNIRNCLESLSWANEVIVLDSGSVDKTIEIAYEYTQHVYETEWQGYGVQKNHALSLATNDWVLDLHPEEFVNSALRKEIEQIITTPKMDAYQGYIHLFFNKKIMRYAGRTPRQTRLFKRAGARFTEEVGKENIILPAKSTLGKLSHPILRRDFNDLSHAIHKMNRYSSYVANQKLQQKKQIGLIKTFIRTGWSFAYYFILKRGFIDGQDGLILAMLFAQNVFFQGLKQLYPDRHS